MAVELLHERIKARQRSADRVDWSLDAVGRVPGHLGENLPPSQQVGVGYGFGSHVFPCLVQLGSTGRSGAEDRIKTFDRPRVRIPGQ